MERQWYSVPRGWILGSSQACFLRETPTEAGLHSLDPCMCRVQGRKEGICVCQCLSSQRLLISCCCCCLIFIYLVMLGPSCGTQDLWPSLQHLGRIFHLWRGSSWLQHADLVPWPRVEPEPPVLGAWNPSYWTPTKVPCCYGWFGHIINNSRIHLFRYSRDTYWECSECQTLLGTGSH